MGRPKRVGLAELNSELEKAIATCPLGGLRKHLIRLHWEVVELLQIILSHGDRAPSMPIRCQATRIMEKLQGQKGGFANRAKPTESWAEVGQGFVTCQKLDPQLKGAFEKLVKAYCAFVDSGARNRHASRDRFQEAELDLKEALQELLDAFQDPASAAIAS